jgi:hypothetical protein
MMTDLDHQHSQLDIDMKILSVNVQPTTDTSLPAFDNTKLVAMNTCPTWGILRYTQHKTTKGTGRAMALEAGAAAHEVFAAHRLYYLLEYARDYYTEFNHEFIRTTIDSAGQRIFGQHRFGEMVASINQSEDFRTRCNQFALTALYNSGFYDDPRDKRRTTTNIEEMCIAYMDRMDFRDRLPVMFSNGFVGIEIPVDVTITIDYINDLGEDAQLVCRFIGKADGVHYTDKTKKLIRVHENKTAFRLGEAWERSWDTNHQPTGYMIALTAMLNKQITQSEMLGTTLPMPRNFSLDGTVVAAPNTTVFDLSGKDDLYFANFKDRDPLGIVKTFDHFDSYIFDSLTSISERTLARGISITKGATVERPSPGAYMARNNLAINFIRNVLQLTGAANKHVCFVAHEGAPQTNDDGALLGYTMSLGGQLPGQTALRINECWPMFEDSKNRKMVIVRKSRLRDPAKSRMFDTSNGTEFEWKFNPNDWDDPNNMTIEKWYDAWVKNGYNKLQLPK